MTDETTSDTPQEPSDTDADSPTVAPAPGEEKHTLKQELRDVVGKVVGIAVETGSMLSGNAGDLVSAEGAVAEADTEKFIDSIDGEG